MQVFISHHSESAGDVALHVAQYLERHGIDCWVAPRDILPGEDWDAGVVRGLTSSGALVLLFSKQADDSKYVKRELMIAEDEELLVLPLRLEAVKPTALRLLLASPQWIDWMDRRDATLDRLVTRLRGFGGGTHVAAPQQVVPTSEDQVPRADAAMPLPTAAGGADLGPQTVVDDMAEDVVLPTRVPGAKKPGVEQPVESVAIQKERTDPALIRTITGHTGPVICVAFGAVDGRPLLATGSRDETLRLWDPATGTHLHTLTGHTGMVISVAFGTVHGRPLLATGSGDRTVRLWDPATGTHLHTLTGHTRPVMSVAFGTVDGRTVLATGSADRTVRLWDPANGTHQHTLTGNTGSVMSVAFGTVHGRPLLATGSGDHTVRLWDPANGTHLHTLTGNTNTVMSVAFGTVHGRPVLATGSADLTVRLFGI